MRRKISPFFVATAVFVLALTGTVLVSGATGAADPLSAVSSFPLTDDDRLQDVGVYDPNFFAELQDVELHGDLAYVFGVGGLAIIDISDTANPVLLGRYEPPGHPYNRFYRGAVDGGLACGGGREDLLSIVDVSRPLFATLLSVYGQAGHAYEGAAMRDGYIFACRHTNGLEVIDVQTPTLPVGVAVVTELTNAWDVVLSGDVAYIADGLSGLAVVDVSIPTSPVFLGHQPTSGAATDVTVDGNLAVVTNGSLGIDVFDLTDPYNPVLTATANTSALAVSAALVGTTVYVADWDDVEAFDLSDPYLPVPAGGEDTPVRAMGLAARADLVVVADWSRLRLYTPGATSLGDIQIELEAISFGAVPLGATVDTTFAIGNTGGAPLTVTGLLEFSINFELLTAAPLVIPPGETRDVTLAYTKVEEGYDATFVRIESDDGDEASVTLQVSADDNPNQLNLGDPAPDFFLFDMDDQRHDLSDYLGKVVVLAFFANW